MLVNDEEAAELKTWVVKKLEDISDADSDVLADYVLALIRADTPEAELKVNAIENLEDFLKDNTAAFVEEVFFVIRNKSYLPGYSMSKPETQPPPFTAPLGPSGAYGQLGGRGGFNGGGQQSRKRSYNDRQEEGNGVDAHYNRGDRQMKHPRMGGARGGRSDSFGGRGGRGGRPAHQPSGLPGIPSPAALGFPGILPPPPAMPFDPNDPMAAMLAMQHAMSFPPLPGLPLPPQAPSPTGFPPFPPQNTPAAGVQPRQRINARCRDYDTKGFCTRGNACPFEHGTDLIVVPGQQEEYDPKNSVMLDIQRSPTDTNGHTTFDSQRGNDRGRGRGRGRSDRGGPINTYTPRRNRADFSYAGPINDRSITTIVVEQIPEEKFDEQSVRDFFGDFGEIEEVTMQAYKRLALVKYSDWASAKRAYDSPKVIFDNRFVKVYWYKPDSFSTPPANGSSEKPGSPSSVSKAASPPFDREKFARDALAAQKKLEAKKALLASTEAKRATLERQKEDLARKQAEEKAKLQARLAAKGARSVDASAASPTAGNGALNNGTNGAKAASAKTEMLRAQLATLEAEAKSLGIDPAAASAMEEVGGGGEGEGEGKSQGGFISRLGGGVGEFTHIEASPDSQIVTFKDRYTAEQFFYGEKDIPGVGRVELAWVGAPSGGVGGKGGGDGDGDTGMGGVGVEGGDREDGAGKGLGHAGVAVAVAVGGGVQDTEFDVAEEDERWMVE